MTPPEDRPDSARPVAVTPEADVPGLPAAVPPALAPEAPRGGLARAGTTAVLWQGTAQFLGKAVVLVTTVVLARLLAPADFGLVALAMVLIVYAEVLASTGVAQALIYLGRTPSVVRAALGCSIVAGLVLTGAAVAAAPLIASFFDNPDVVPIVRLLAVGLFASALGAVPEALLQRDLLFSRLTIATVARSMVTGAVSVGLALSGYGAISLAWGNVAGGVSFAVLTWALLPDRPDAALWRTRRSDVRQVVGYGIPVAGSSMLQRAIYDIDYLIIGRMLGVSALGYYSLAFRLPELLILNVFFVLSSVAFPLYSKVRGDREALRRGYFLAVRLFSLYGLCAGVGMAVVAPVLVPVVFGRAWEGAVGPLVALALYAACRSIAGGANDIYKATGRPGVAVVLAVARLLVLVPVLVTAAWFWGVVGVAYAQLATSAIFVVVMQGVAVRMLGARWLDAVRAMAPSFVAAGAVAMVASALVRLPVTPVLVLIITIVGGVLAAVGSLALTHRPFLRELIGLVVRRSAAAPR
jgi:PST family polysaccharide transporter